MRLRFLAAAGAGSALDALTARVAAASSLSLQPVLRAPELAVWAAPGTPHLAAPGGPAVAVGLLFERSDDRRLEHLPVPLPSAEDFLTRFWGAYVLLTSRGEAGHAVLRDPSGGITAYHRRCGALDVYASDAAMLTAAGAERLEPDPEFLRQWLTYPALRSGRTGVRGVRELVPGSVLRRTGASEQWSLPWSPWAHAGPDKAIDDFDAAAALLREAICRTVPRLADGAADVVVQLSGGLDSSIVAAALAHGGRPFRAVTFATLAPDGDERVHAREVARHCGAELVELTEEAASPDFEQPGPLALRPRPNALLQRLHRAFANHLALTGAELTLDGSGGDNVFCYLASASPALDAFGRHGARAGLAAVQDLARLHGATVWAVGRAALRRSRRPRVGWTRDESFLARDAAAAQPPAHPWLEPAGSAPRGTLEHVQSIVGIHHFLADPANGAVAALHPLLAQPVLEACLRIPSWLWVRGGRDRAVARAAFRGLLPDRILARRSKGHLSSLFMGSYMAGRTQLEALLLEGRMARAGLLDRTAIEAYLRCEGQPADAGYMRLLELASAEAWLRSFER